MILRSEAAVHVPKDVDPAAFAPMLCAGVTVFNSIRNMGITPGSLVAVQGLGGLGHLAIQFAHHMGYRVVALSSSSGKEEFAKKLGAHDYVDTSTQDASTFLQGLGGASLIVTTAPNPKAIEPLIYGLKSYGTLLNLTRMCSSRCSFGNRLWINADVVAAVGALSLDTGPLITKALSVRGWSSGHAIDSEDCIAFAVQNDINCLIEKFPLKEYAAAYDRMMSGKARFRAVLVME